MYRPRRDHRDPIPERELVIGADRPIFQAPEVTPMAETEATKDHRKHVVPNPSDHLRNDVGERALRSALPCYPTACCYLPRAAAAKIRSAISRGWETKER